MRVKSCSKILEKLVKSKEVISLFVKSLLRCISNENSFEQEVCECDVEFAENISEEYVDDSKVDYPTKKCSHGSSLEPKKIRSALFADELSLTRF